MWFRSRRDNSAQESEDALKDARKNLKLIKGRSEEVEEIAEAFREFRQRNHFAEQMEAIMRHRRRNDTRY